MCHQPHCDVTQEEVAHTSYMCVFVNKRQQLYYMYEPVTMQYLYLSSRYNIHVYTQCTCVFRELLRMIVTKLWFNRRMKIHVCVGIVRGHVWVVCECVGTVCVALLGTVYCVGECLYMYTCRSSYPGCV